MCCDLIELLFCGHDGKQLGWEICPIQNLMQAERIKGTPEDTQLMKEYDYICRKSPPVRRVVTITDDRICEYCRLYVAGKHASEGERRGLGS
jgi:hypothetical protein